MSGPSGMLGVLQQLCVAQARRDEIERVAVVANAPMEADARRAAEIDESDLVFRVNGFHLDADGDAPSVGRRADVVVFNRALRATPWSFRSYRSRLYLLAEPGRLHWEAEAIPAWWPPDLGYVTLPNREVVIPACEAVGIDVLADPRWPTTGTLMAWLAVTLFPAADISVSGFSFLDDDRQRAWEHGYGLPSAVGAEHVIEREAALMRGWLADGRARRL